MVTKAKYVPQEDMLGIVIDELESSTTRPNILAYTPYPEQERFHSCDAFGRYISGGNRGGKTNSIVAEMVWWGTNTHPYLMRPDHWGRGPLHQRVIVVDITKGVEQIILPKLRELTPKSALIDGVFEKSWDSNSLIFTFANGSTIDFLTHGMTLEKHGGVPRHILYFDEIPPQHVFNEALMRLVDYGGRWIIAATSVDGMGWTYDFLVEPLERGDIARDELEVFTMTQDMNPFLAGTKESRNRYYIGMSDEETRIRRDGEFVAKTGPVFPVFKKNTHVIPSFTPPRDWTWYTSVDFGWNNPTAWLWHAVSPTGDIVTFAEHYQSRMTIPEHASVVKLKELQFMRPADVRVGDPHGDQTLSNTGLSHIQEYAARGIYIGTHGIPRGPGSSLIAVEKMQQYFALRAKTGWGENRPKWVVTEDCVNLVRELQRLRWASYETAKKSYEMNAKDEIHKKDDHAFDSMKYLATLMPNLVYEPATEADRVPITVSYAELMMQQRLDPSITFADDIDTELTWELEEERIY